MTHTDFLPVAQPRLPDVKSCEDWLARATLADARSACDAFLSLLDELEDAPPKHATYLQILERLRAPIRAAQEQHSLRFLGKPLPLGHLESAAFTQVSDLWMALLRGYRRLLRAGLSARRAELRTSLPLLCYRALETTAELIHTRFAARRSCDDDLWQWLHEVYAAAQANAVIATPIPEGAGTSDCTAIYVRPLLLALASPYGLPVRELTWAQRWIRRWSGKVRLVEDDQEGYRVDLSGDGGGAAWASSEPGIDSRRLELDEVGRSIRRRLHKLAQGADPGELGLGRDCVQPAAKELLEWLLRSWLDRPRTRETSRRSAGTHAELLSGFAAIHQTIAGRPLLADANQWQYTRRDTEQIQVFQRALDVAGRQETAAELRPESWEAIDESAEGFRLQRKTHGARLALRQLIALRPHGARQYILAEIRWLCQGSDQGLSLGTRALPGLARACAVRPLMDAGGTAAAAPAMLLTIGPGLPPSLVLPAGWYQNARVIELELDGKSTRIRLFGLLARGFDYDRVHFSAVA